MAQDGIILAVNCGSSSVKIAVHEAGLDRLATGLAARIGTAKTVELSLAGDGFSLAEDLPAGTSHADCILHLAEAVRARFGTSVAGIGHRVVHGGTGFIAPVVIDEANLAAIEALTPLAPAHQPHNLRGIRAFGAAFPGAVQVACFDTAFHRTIPLTRQLYAIPVEFARQGLLAYGFHGLSCQHSVGHFAAVTGRPLPARLALCHLGNGASVTAVLDGRSVANSMGFTPLDGLVMGSRSGRIDPGAVLWLVERLGDTASVRDLLNTRSGLAGLSGRTSDMRSLLADPDPGAQAAIESFIDRLVREIGSVAAAMGGIDAILFTGGIGERAGPIRARVIEAFGWLGARLDAPANAAHAATITTADSALSAHVIAADEERVLAEAVLTYLSA